MKAPGIKYQTIFYDLGWKKGVLRRLFPKQNTEFKGYLKFLICFLP